MPLLHYSHNLNSKTYVFYHNSCRKFGIRTQFVANIFAILQISVDLYRFNHRSIKKQLEPI